MNRIKWEDILIYMAAFWLVAVAFVVVTVPSLILNGFVFMKMWNWFVLGNLSSYKMTLVIGIALNVFVSFATSRMTATKDERTDKEKMVASLSYCLFAPLLVLLTGWILTLFL
jgi:NADH:ubiquinone oxidoreductase subunit 6 (subunit J)